MDVCLSPNGPMVHRGAEPPQRLFIGTLAGVVILERETPRAAWTTTATTLNEKHISSLLAEGRHGGLFAGIHGGGLYLSMDSGRNWERRTSGLTVEHVFSLACAEDPGEPLIFAGTLPVSLFVSRDYGRSWQDLAAIRGVSGQEKWSFPGLPSVAHVKSLTVDSRDRKIIYVAVEQGALLKSVDGGNSWRELDNYSRSDDPWYKDIHRIVPVPSKPDELFMTTGVGLYHSRDGGETWRNLTGSGFRIGYPDHLVISPLDRRVMFMSGAGNTPTTWQKSHYSNATVLRSRDAGLSWEPADRGLPESRRANIEAMSIASYPAGFDLFLANTDGEIFASVDQGESWIPIATGLRPISKLGHHRLLVAAPA